MFYHEAFCPIYFVLIYLLLFREEVQLFICDLFKLLCEEVFNQYRFWPQYWRLSKEDIQSLLCDHQ